jgi:branched-chain amino acid transport system substrate-binding protein
MRKFVLLTILILATWPLLATETRPVLKVGFVVPMTGDCAFMGQDIRDGATLALDEYGATKIDYKLIFEDDQLIPRLSNASAIKLTTLDKVDCIWSLWAQGATAVMPWANKAGIIHMNTGWDHSYNEKSKWCVVHGASYQDNARQNIEYFLKHGVKRLAIAPQRAEGWVRLVDYALPLIRKANIEVVFNEYTNPGERDFRVYWLKIKNSKPDMIWAPITSPELDIFFRQKQELDIHIPITGYFTTFQKDSLKYAQGIEYFSDTWVRSDFLERFNKRFGHTPLIRAGHAYDLMKLYIQSAEELYKKLGRVPTHEELLVKLKEPRELPNLVVGPGRMTANGSIETGYKLVKVEGDKIVDVKE